VGPVLTSASPPNRSQSKSHAPASRLHRAAPLHRASLERRALLSGERSPRPPRVSDAVGRTGRRISVADNDHHGLTLRRDEQQQQPVHSSSSLSSKRSLSIDSGGSSSSTFILPFNGAAAAFSPAPPQPQDPFARAARQADLGLHGPHDRRISAAAVCSVGRLLHGQARRGGGRGRERPAASELDAEWARPVARRGRARRGRISDEHASTLLGSTAPSLHCSTARLPSTAPSVEQSSGSPPPRLPRAASTPLRRALLRRAPREVA
jgi:hypothetical protein